MVKLEQNLVTYRLPDMWQILLEHLCIIANTSKCLPRQSGLFQNCAHLMIVFEKSGNERKPQAEPGNLQVRLFSIRQRVFWAVTSHKYGTIISALFGQLQKTTRIMVEEWASIDGTTMMKTIYNLTMRSG